MIESQVWLRFLRDAFVRSGVPQVLMSTRVGRTLGKIEVSQPEEAARFSAYVVQVSCRRTHDVLDGESTSR